MLRWDINPKYCDPGVCDHCQYIGEGDFLCDKTNTIVISDWVTTDDYLMCRKEN